MRKYKKILIFSALLLIGLILNRKYGLSLYLKEVAGKEGIKDFVEKNYILSVVYYLIFALLGSSLLALPGVTFAVVSSGIFGPWLGSLYCLIGTVSGSVLSFLLSRYLLKDFAEELIKKNKKLYNIIFISGSEKEMLILMITRLLPIFPFNLQNFAYGITNISIVKYTLGSFLFMIPGILIFSLATEGFINQEKRAFMFMAVLALAAFMFIIGFYLYRKYKRLTTGEIDER